MDRPGHGLIADLLRIDIAVMTENGPARSGELGLGSAHDSAWTGLKDDDTRFAEGAGNPSPALFPLSSIGRTARRASLFRYDPLRILEPAHRRQRRPPG